MKMKVAIRRIGNSLGVILPKIVLEKWGVDEGDFLDLNDRGIQPRRRAGFSHQELDEHKRRIAAAVASGFTANLIRATSLANLHRWKASGVWVSAFDEWKELLENSNDGELFSVLLGRDEHSNRLRQSPPYVGLLSRDDMERLNEEAAR